MRRTLLSLALVAIGLLTLAQTPNSFNYQAVVRAADGNILQNSTVSFRFSVLEGNATGTAMYVETQSATTNQYGLVDLTIGDGTLVSGSMTNVDWAGEANFLKIEMDVDGGSSYADMSTQQLVAVPYAMHANTVTNSDNDNANEIQDLSKSGSTISLSDGGGDVTLDDDDASNELQTLSKSGNNVTLSDGGGTVSIADNDNSTNNELQTLSKTGNNVTLSDGGGTVNIADNDNNSSNEIQVLGSTATQLTLNNGGGAVDKDDINYWQKVTPGLTYDEFVGIGTTAPLSELVVASDSAILTIGSAGATPNGVNSGILRFTEGVDYTSYPLCGMQFNYNGSTNKLILEGGCNSPGAGTDTAMTILRSGNIGFGTYNPGFNVEIDGTFGVSAGMTHAGDNDTRFDFMDDNVRIVAGNESLLTLTESTQDAVDIGDGGDVDISLNDVLFTNGQYGNIQMGDPAVSTLYFVDITPGEFDRGIWVDHNHTESGTTYGMYYDLDNTYTASASTYGGYFDAYKSGTAGTVYGLMGRGRNYEDAGSTSPTYGVYAYGFRNNTSTSTTYALYAIQSGSASTEYAGYFAGNVYTSGSYLPSDAKLKSNIEERESSLSLLMDLSVYDYNYDTDRFSHMNLPEGEQTGFLANELADVFPELTTQAVQPELSAEEQEDLEMSGMNVPEAGKSEVEFTAVNYAGLVPHLTKAIQEQQAMIEELQAKIAALEAANESSNNE
ncbi:MAG: tail fiber domain-containing protein [Bacteroidia bacterium]